MRFPKQHLGCSKKFNFFGTQKFVKTNFYWNCERLQEVQKFEKKQSKLAIVNYKIGRNKTKYEYKPEFKKVLSAESKAGTISSKAIEKIKKLSKLENCLLELNFNT